MPHHRTYIAGAKHRPGAAEALAAMGEGSEALTLEPDPNNAFDPHAVKIMLNELHVGFVPRDLAPEIGVLIQTERLQKVVKRSGKSIEIHYSEE